MLRCVSWLTALGIVIHASVLPAADDPTEPARRAVALSNQPTGLLVPLYHYPANVHTNAHFNRLIDLKLEHATVPVCAIVNPASGPGEGPVDANYIKAIDRLTGAGVITLGYVSTEYGKRSEEAIRRDILQWRERYPRVVGLFFDEMGYSAEEPSGLPRKYAGFTSFAHEHGYWPVFANPGTDTPEVFFRSAAADVFVICESRDYPTEERLKGDYFGGYADDPPSTRSVLIYGAKTFDRDKFRLMKKYTRWVYVTDDTFDSPQDNPWDTLSTHMEVMFEELESPGN